MLAVQQFGTVPLAKVVETDLALQLGALGQGLHRSQTWLLHIKSWLSYCIHADTLLNVRIFVNLYCHFPLTAELDWLSGLLIHVWLCHEFNTDL